MDYCIYVYYAGREYTTVWFTSLPFSKIYYKQLKRMLKHRYSKATIRLELIRSDGKVIKHYGGAKCSHRACNQS